MHHRHAWRRGWVRIHSWLGLSAGLVLAFVGLTGSLLVYRTQLDVWLHPELLSVEAGAQQIAPATALASARGQFTGDERIIWLSLPGDPDNVYRAYGGPPGDRFARMVTLDPHDGRILGSRAVGADAISFLYGLHYQLGLGDGGQQWLGAIGVLLLVSLGSGIYLWWPRNGGWRARLTVRRGARAQRRDFDLHRVFGIYGSVIVALLVGSGIFMAVPAYTKPLVAWFTPAASGTRTPPASMLAPADASIDLHAAIERARHVLTGASVTGIGLPDGEDGAYRVTLREPAHPRESAGRSHVLVGRSDGLIRSVRRWSNRTASQHFFAWQPPLHNGEAFGPIGRFVVFLAGWLPLGMWITGFRIWRHKRRARQHRTNRRPRPGPPGRPLDRTTVR